MPAELIFFIYLFVFVAPAIVLAIVFSSIHRKRKQFVLEHSVALKTINNINNKYKFHVIKTLNFSNYYDNEHFYNEISPIDYLTYKINENLFFYESEVKKSISNTNLYSSYIRELKVIKCLGIYDTNEPIQNKEKLDQIEKNIFKSYIIRKPQELDVIITLYLTNIKGDTKEKKVQKISIYNIIDLINKIKQKNGSFYLNKDIWNSLCKVERGKVSNKLRFYIYNRDYNRCRWCHSTQNLEIDHIMPISKGGKSTPDNLQTLCKNCNSKKGDYY